MSKTTGDDWRQLAEAAQKEQDPTKLMELINELNHKLERRARDLESHRARWRTELRCGRFRFLTEVSVLSPIR
jgi:hypothetical protein